MQPRKNLLAASLLLSFNTFTAQAALIDRGGGLLYDTVLNVTWLQDANYAKTSGYDNDGLMNWADANTWAANLVYHDSVRNVNYDDWRLPTVKPGNGSSYNYNYNTSVNGSTDMGYNITSPHSELSYMYHVNLGLKSVYSLSGDYQPDSGIFGDNTVTGGQNNVGLVKNLQSYAYWSGSEGLPDPRNAWDFYTFSGLQYLFTKGYPLHAWAVRPGDVTAVPVPAAVLLFGSGLLGLIGLKRRDNIG